MIKNNNSCSLGLLRTHICIYIYISREPLPIVVMVMVYVLVMVLVLLVLMLLLILSMLVLVQWSLSLVHPFATIGGTTSAGYLMRFVLNVKLVVIRQLQQTQEYIYIMYNRTISSSSLPLRLERFYAWQK